VTIGGNVETIGKGAFEGCTGLTSVTIPNSVITLGQAEAFAEFGVFKDCTGLTSVTIGSNVETIGGRAFYGCTGLTSVTIGSNVETIGNSAFEGCRLLKSIVIPDSVTVISESAFSGCYLLASVTIGSNVKNISHSAFSGCRLLESIVIPDSVEIIGTGAFSGCTSLESVVIPDSVLDIGNYAFQSCSSLVSVTVTREFTEEYLPGVIERCFNAEAAWALPGQSSATVMSLTLEDISSLEYDPNNTDGLGGIAGDDGRRLVYSDAEFVWDAPFDLPARWGYSVLGTLTVIGGSASEEGVTITLTHGAREYTAETGPDGVYAVRGLPVGTEGDITAEITGYHQTITPSASPLSGSVEEKDLTLEIDTYKVSGTLTVNGGSASNVGVTVSLGTSGLYTAVTTAGGAYEINGVPYETSGKITATISGYTQTVTPSVTSISNDQSGMDLTLVVAYKVSGTLTVNGGSASNVGVEVYLGTLHATTAAGGAYTITGVPHGTTENITATITGYTQTGTASVTAIAADATGKNITLEYTAPAPATPSAAQYYYRVTFDSGPNYTVYVNGSPVSSAITVAEGEILVFFLQATEGYSVSPSVVSGNAEITVQADGRYKISGIHSNVHVTLTATLGSGSGGGHNDSNDGSSDSTDTDGEWAVLNLVCAIIAICAGIIVIAAGRNHLEENARKIGSKTAGTLRAAPFILGIASMVVFFLTEDVSLNPVAADAWTVPMFILLMCALVLAAIGLRPQKIRKTDKH
jgi:predicted membrane protein